MPRSWVLVALLSVAVLAPRAAAAKPDARSRKLAKERNKAALQAMKAQRYRVAAKLFDTAWDLDPSPLILWNAARAHQLACLGLKQSGRDADAIDHAGKAVERFRRLLALKRGVSRRFRRDSLLHKADLELKLKEWRQAAEPPPVAAPRVLRRPPEAAAARFERTLSAELRWPGPPSTEGLSIAGWTLGGLGLAALGTGLGLLIHAEVLRGDVEAAQQDLIDDAAHLLSREQALSKLGDADALTDPGLGLAIAGGALTVGAIVLLVLGDSGAPAPAVAPVPGGGVVSGLRGGF